MNKHLFSMFIGCFISYSAFTQSWQYVPLVNNLGAGAAVFHHDTGTVLGTSGYIYYTTDFFNTYYVDSTYYPNRCDAISFANSDIGYITSPAVYDGLLKTNDGGESWVPVLYGDIKGDNWGNILIATSPDTVYAALWDNIYIYYTYNAGKTWNEDRYVNVPQSQFERISRFEIRKDSIIYALGSPKSCGLCFYQFAKSNNYGVDWQELFSFFAGTHYGDFHFLDDSTVIMSAGNLIFRSTDAGVTFDTVLHTTSIDDVYHGNTNSISFPTHDTGYITFAHSMYKTYNAGKTWKEVNFTPNPGVFLCGTFIYALTAQKVLTGCNDGLYKTTNGGEDWSTIFETKIADDIAIYPNPTTNQLYITTSGFQPQLICLYDINGRKLKEMKFAEQIDIAALNAGIYFLELSSATGVVRRKFVKE